MNGDADAILDRLGLTPEKVRELVARNTRLPGERVIELLARKKNRYGRHGLPEVIVKAMIAEYRRTNSLAKTGHRFGRTRQAIWDILRRHIALNPCHPRLLTPVFYRGEKFTPTKGGYLRKSAHTGSGENLLQRIVWTEHHGPIPPGHQVMFRDENRRNCAIGNLICISRADAKLGKPSSNAWTKFRKFGGPRPTCNREALSRAQRAVWARYTPAQKKRRLRGIHRRWIERRKSNERMAT